ncbi:hypothetical protein PEC301899_30820 [Pectobacterium carotovorum subsp. carotovorum]|nr:hypothetical protein PEC301899_30820 [Pectobacterium carotovorum subsp. carotovorum]
MIILKENSPQLTAGKIDKNRLVLPLNLISERITFLRELTQPDLYLMNEQDDCVYSMTVHYRKHSYYLEIYMNFGLSQIASQAASQTLDTAMAGSLTRAAGAQAQKMAIDTENSILDGQMDSASKSLNSGQKAAKAIQF